VESLRVRPGDTGEFTDETRIRARSGSISAAIAFPRQIAGANIDSALSACGKASSPLSARRDFCEKIYATEQRRERMFARIREIIGSLADTFHLHSRLIANGSIKRALFTAAPRLRYAPRY